MEFSVINHPHNLEVGMSGQFTFNCNQAFKRIIALLDNGPLESVTLDIKGVEFIDSAGLGMLLLLRDHCLEQHITLSVQGAQGQVQKILALSKFDQLFSAAS